MDKKTQQYYSTHASEATGLYKSAKPGGVSSYFLSAFTSGSSVLDIGTGSGRDLVILAEMGFNVYGIDASPEMVRCAADYASDFIPAADEKIICASIPQDGLFFNIKFDSVLCSAVLMHIPDELLSDTLACIRNNMKDAGRVLVSVPVERDDLDSEGRTPDGRLFIMRSIDLYTELFRKGGFRKVQYYEETDSLGRAGIRWGVILFEVV